MKCLDTNELRKMLMAAGDDNSAACEHVCSCDRCRDELKKLARSAAISAGLCDCVLGMTNCPEYSDLSNFVDANLNSREMNLLQAHVNSCEQCASDVQRMRELRSLAALREAVEVRPGATRAGGRKPLLVRIFGGVALAGAAAAVVMALLPASQPVVQKPSVVAIVPDSPVQSSAKSTPPAAAKPDKVAQQVTPAPTQPAPTAPSAPGYKVIMADGSYQIAKQNGKLVMLKGGNVVAAPRDLMARIVQKVTTGRVPLLQPVATAMTAIHVRSSEGYVPPPTAAKLIEPVASIVMTDTPKLSWSEVELAHSYRLTVKDESGNVVYETITSGTQAATRRLPRGKVYTWQVGVRFSEDDEWTMSRAARFQVLSSRDMALIRQASRSMPGSHLALGVTYESLGLKDEAAREYQHLRKVSTSRF
jgi:hypothetical protein